MRAAKIYATEPSLWIQSPVLRQTVVTRAKALVGTSVLARHYYFLTWDALGSVNRGAKKYLRHKCSLITTNRQWLVSLATCSRTSTKVLALCIPALLSWSVLAFSPCCLTVARWLLHFQASHLTSKLRRKLWDETEKEFFSQKAFQHQKISSRALWPSWLWSHP